MRRLLPALLLLSAAPARAIDFEAKARELAAELITNPSQFFFDYQKDMESTNPLPPGKWLGLNWHAGHWLLPPLPQPIPIPDPTTINLSAKLRIHPEGKLHPALPQVDLIAGYWTLGPLLSQVIEEDPDPASQDVEITDAKFDGYYGGTVLTISPDPRVRIFGGYKFSQMKSELQLNKPELLLGTPVDNFKTGFKDHFLFAGLEHPTSINRYWITQMFYGLNTHDFGAKISWYGRILEFGLNLYPEGTGIFEIIGLSIHPTVNFHLNFG